MHIYVLLNLSLTESEFDLSNASKVSLMVLCRLQFWPNTNWDGLNPLLLINEFFTFIAHAGAVS